MGIKDYIFYQDDWATIYCGDCLTIMPLMEPESVDLVVTDPPYGFDTYETDSKIDIGNIFLGRKRKVIFGYPEILCEWCQCWGRPNEWITWWPTNKSCGRTSGLSRESEAIAIYGEIFELPIRERSRDVMTRQITKSRGNDLNFCKEGDVWRDPSPGCGFNHHLRNHPNEKPIKLLERLIKLCSLEKDIILDPFLGSGTTCVAAKNLNRKSIGIEINDRYCRIAVKRLRQEVFDFRKQEKDIENLSEV